jgi:hypothetical protein
MTVLGLPPGWMQRQTVGAVAGEPFMTFVMGSDDEGDANGDADAAADGDADAADGEQQGGNASAAAPDAAAAGTAAAEAAGEGKGGEDGADAAAAGAAEQQQTARYMFPGINAPLPDGADADAWGAQLDKAKYVARMLGVVS